MGLPAPLGFAEPVAAVLGLDPAAPSVRTPPVVDPVAVDLATVAEPRLAELVAQARAWADR